MKKEDLLTKVSQKNGFVQVIDDSVSPDNKENKLFEKRVLTVQTLNTDGTGGITYVYYMLGKKKDEAFFYNNEPATFDVNEDNNDTKKREALEEYLQAQFDAYFVRDLDLENNWAEATVYTKNSAGDTLQKQTVLVFKDGADPIKHLPVATN